METPGIKIVYHNALGKTAIARKGFKPGELVLVEEPILELKRAVNGAPGIKASMDRIAARLGLPEGFLYAVLDFAMAPEGRREVLLNSFYAPDSDVSDPEVNHYIRSVVALQEMERAAFGHLDKVDIVKFLWICDINVHSDKHGEFLFLIASKFSHSCAANTVWLWKDDKLHYYATRAIKPSESLTFSYIGTGLNLLGSTPFRRKHLQHLHFTCLCSRCLAPDTSRAMKCPGCRASSLVVEYPHENATIPQFRLEDAGRPDHHKIHVAKELVYPWKCLTCGRRATWGEVPVQKEQDLSKIVVDLITRECNPAMGARMLRECEEHLGTGHWLTVVLMNQLCGGQLRALTERDVLPFDPVLVDEWCTLLLSWMGTRMPGTAQEIRVATMVAEIKYFVGDHTGCVGLYRRLKRFGEFSVLHFATHQSEIEALLSSHQGG